MIPTKNAWQALEIADVLFLDMVEYSPLPMHEERQMLWDLQHAVRGTSEFACDQRNDQLISLPTWDSMTLVFFGDLKAPVRCALEIELHSRRGCPLDQSANGSSTPDPSIVLQKSIATETSRAAESMLHDE
jgi:hypothetical protein